MAGVLLEHEFHLWHLDPADLSARRVAHGLLRGQHLHLLAHELLDFDLTFSFITVDHVAKQCGFLSRAFVFANHQHDVHLNEADLLDVLKIQCFDMLQLSLIVKHMEATLS